MIVVNLHCRILLIVRWLFHAHNSTISSILRNGTDIIVILMRSAMRLYLVLTFLLLLSRRYFIWNNLSTSIISRRIRFLSEV
jgi:hypothetical protein